MNRPIRIAHLVSHPIQYFAPLYRELASRPGIDLTVYFYSDVSVRAFHDAGFGRAVEWDTPLLDGYRYRMMPSAHGAPASDGMMWRPNLDIVREIATRGYDVVWAHGYMHATTWLAALAARARGATVLIRDEQTLLHKRLWPRSAAKAIALRALVGMSSGLYIGEQNRRHFLRYGMPSERLFSAPYCVDNAFFQERARELAPRRREVRESFGITGDAPVVLFTGKLVEKKQPLALIEAFSCVRAATPCWLLIAGDGPLRPAAEELVRRKGIPDVLFAGFLNQSELPRAYTAADVFVLPSRLHETWGLVVNEAMNFGLPVVVTDKVGCAADLVQPGENGFVVRDSSRELAQAIRTLVMDPALRWRFGSRSLSLIERYSVEACADGIISASLARGRRPVRKPELVSA